MQFAQLRFTFENPKRIISQERWPQLPSELTPAVTLCLSVTCGAQLLLHWIPTKVN